jgi:hypothetical protein
LKINVPSAELRFSVDRLEIFTVLVAWSTLQLAFAFSFGEYGSNLQLLYKSNAAGATSFKSGLLAAASLLFSCIEIMMSFCSPTVWFYGSI